MANGGERGIRTPGGFYPTHAFQACALSHSAISPAGAVWAEAARGASFLADSSALPVAVGGAETDGRE